MESTSETQSPRLSNKGTNDSEWEYVHLKEVLEETGGGVSVNGEDRPARDDEIGVLKVSCVKEGRFIPSENKAVLPSDLSRVQGKFEIGDILVSRANTPELVGACGYVSSNHSNLYLSDKIWRFRPKTRKRDDAKYLTYILASDDIRIELTNRATGTSKSMKNISKGAFLGIKILRPPFTEQLKIAEILSTWDDGIKLLNSRIAEKLDFKNGLYQHFLSDCRVDESGRRSEEFKIYRLGDLFDERVETSRGDLRLLSITNNRGVIPRDDLVKRDTSNPDKTKYLRICPGDLGYNTMRMWQGVSALSRLEGIVSPAYTICIPKSGLIDGQFAAHLFKYTPMIHLFKRHSQGLVDDTLGLKFDVFKTIKICIPGLSEQKRIAEVLNLVDLELSVLHGYLELLKKEKQVLMQKLLTGKIRVKV